MKRNTYLYKHFYFTVKVWATKKESNSSLIDTRSNLARGIQALEITISRAKNEYAFDA